MPNKPDTSWWDTLSGAARTVAPSVLGQVKNMALGVKQAVLHPSDTASALHSIAHGAITGTPRTPQDVKDKAIAKAAWAGIADKYSAVDPKTGERHFDLETFKHTLATDPGAILSDVSTVLPMGGGAASLVGKVAGKTGDLATLGGLARTANTAAGVERALRATGRMLTKTGNAANPLAVAALPVRGVARVAKDAGVPSLGRLATGFQSMETGAPRRLLGAAYDAGKGAGPPNAAETFAKFRGGQGSAAEIQQTALRGLRQIKKEASDAYLQGKAPLLHQPVAFTRSDQALRDLDIALNKGSALGFADAKQALGEARDMIDDLRTAPQVNASNIENADALKQQIWELGAQYRSPKAQQVIGELYNAVKGDIHAVDPRYSDLMETYQEGLKNIGDIASTFGTKDSVAATTALARTLKRIKTPGGSDLFEQLTAKEPELPFMLAGHVARDWQPHGAGRAADILAVPAAIAHVASTGDVIGPALAAGQIAASSPAVNMGLNYAAGKVAGALPSASPALLPAAAAAGEFEQAHENRPLTPEEAGVNPKAYAPPAQAGNVGSHDYEAADDKPLTPEEAGFHVPREDAPPRDVAPVTAPPADAGAPLPPTYTDEQGLSFGLPDDRQQRASGGKVSTDIEPLVRSLIHKMKKAKTETDRHTEGLLKHDDSAIVRALSVAKQAI